MCAACCEDVRVGGMIGAEQENLSEAVRELGVEGVVEIDVSGHGGMDHGDVIVVSYTKVNHGLTYCDALQKDSHTSFASSRYWKAFYRYISIRYWSHTCSARNLKNAGIPTT
jgi:hypothetical protein